MGLFNQKLACFLANVFAGLLPIFSARISYTYWVRTHRYPTPERELGCLHTAEQNWILVEGKEVAVYSWGQGPRVLLLHGWNGRATQYFAFIDVLLTQGYSVLAFDAPGHGKSGGVATNVKQITQVVRCLYEQYGEFQAMIGHSFGFFVVANALAGDVKSEKVVGISSPADFALLLKAFICFFGLNAKAGSALSDYLKLRYNLNSFDEISVHQLAKKLSVPCLIVHDENDLQVPISEAYKIKDAWQGAELYRTRKCGHLRILHDPAVVKHCVKFLAAQ